MIKDIVEALNLVDGDTELIRVAQGKNYLPKGAKESVKYLKRIWRWQRKEQ